VAPVVYEYGNEETDEARTNEEEGYEDLAQYRLRKQEMQSRLKSSGDPIYFNEEGDRAYDDEDEYE